jgi:phosphate-selective porin OprO/OprP
MSFNGSRRSVAGSYLPALLLALLASRATAEDGHPRAPRPPRRLPPIESEAESALEHESVEGVAVDAVQADFVQGGVADDLAKRVAELEQQLKKSADADKKKKEDETKKPTHKFSMQLQADSYFSSQDQANKDTVGDIPNGGAFRRARFGFSGDYSVFDYRIEMDFALAGRPSFLDVFAGMNDLPYVGHVRIGHFFEPFSLERITRNRFTTFMERALPDQPFAPARNLGIMIFDWSDDEMMTWHLGTFYVNSDVWGDAVGDSHGHSVTGRMTRLLWYDEPSGGRYYFHVGGGYSFRGSDHKRVRFWVPVDRIDGPNPSFEGWYFQTTYFLTGEHRPYNRKDGTMDRVYPHEDFFRVNTPAGICTGKGAWEVAFRVSHLDLDSQGINGGKVTDLTVGLNWYMNPWTRVTTDWVHSFLDRAPGGNSHADLWGIRMGFEF